MIVNYPRMRRRAAWPDDLNTALEFASPEAFSISTTKNWDGKIEYSNGSGWKTWDGAKITSGVIENKNVIYFRGVGNTKVSGDEYGDNRWVITGQTVSCKGDIERLLNWEDVKNGKHPAMSDYCYAGMFYNCTSLTTAPALPATTLNRRCYDRMFSTCISLTTVPALPATMLTDNCYEYMFLNCRKIKVSATANGTYTRAYRIPRAGAGTISNSSVRYMFAGTGGTFTGDPEINTTYYLDKSNTIV